MAKLIDVANAMFRYKNKWSEITNEDKEEFFFIFNRFFSKMYPEKSQLLNTKNIDKVSSMDLWYYFMYNKPYPNWFWSKGGPKDKLIIPNKDFLLLMKKFNVKGDDIDYLIEHHFDFIKDELKYYKSIEKGN